MNYKIIGILVILSLLFFSCGQTKTDTPAKPEKTEKNKGEKMGPIKDHADIKVVKGQIAKLAPVNIDFDSSILSENEKKALDLMVQAAKYMDKIFLTQVYGQNKALEAELQKKGNEAYPVLAEYFKIHFGPFDRLDDHHPFINSGSKKPLGANYYPEDMTKEEFQAHIKANPADAKAFTSEFTLIRKKDGKLTAIPYNEAYKEYLEPAAKLMKEAAELIDNPSLKKYLNSRADAFASNDYYQSDIDWVLLKDHNIEIVIGPYEVYEDSLFNYKAAFECFITVVDKEESKKLQSIGKHLDAMEKHLPYDDKYRNFKRGKSSPIFVVNEVYTSGDTKAGVQTTAFNLPNDERVRESTGSKKVMLKNISKAKFENCWIPIVKEVLAEVDLPLVSFDSYFNHVLMHEVSHGLGPGTLTIDGKETSVGKELKELYSTIEEAKADILGLYLLQFMIDKGEFPKDLEKHIYISYLGGIFRSVRFGIGEAHGGANVIQLNYLMEKDGFYFDEKAGRFGVNKEKIREAVKQLSHDLLMIEALGDYAKAREMITKYKLITPQLQIALDKVKHVPIDIRPIYAIEK
ncbi:MAG: peptidase [bacterium]|nr:peptidase [bacterium]